jgi:PadR family transcriptional regulator PadR
MIENHTQPEAYEKIALELRRGVLILAALSQLKENKYGYALISQLAENGLDIDQGTLYPLLRRLESQGLLDSNWIVEDSRPRRYYVLNATGKQVLDALVQEWRTLNNVMNTLLKDVE